MRATSEELEDNKVKIAVEVDEAEVETAVATAVRTLARQVRIPGFRPGKAPRPVVEARIGGPRALRDEALRELLPDLYARAISQTEVEPISPPELNVTKGEEEGPVEFDAVVEVRPRVYVTGHGSLRVTIPSPLPTDDEVQQLLDRLRETDAELREVGRPIVTGDYVTMDVRGRDDEGHEIASVDDYVYVVGAGTIVDVADDQLVGMRPGETLEVAGTAPGGSQMSFTLVLKDVRERVLPELTDEWVEENSEHATVQALRDATIERIRTAKLDQARRAKRDAVFGELAGQVADAEVPESLLDAETRERFGELQESLSRSGVTVESFLDMTRQTPDGLLEALRLDALHAVKVDLALRSVVAQEDLATTDDELDAELERLSAGSTRSPAKLRDELTEAGRLPALRAEAAKRKAADWVLERVTYVDETGAEIDKALLDDDAPQGADDGAEPVDQPAGDTED